MFCRPFGYSRSRQTGFSSRLSTKCSSCQNIDMMATSGNSSTKGVSYDINRRLVYTTTELGCGYERLATLSSIMNMPCLTKGAYYKQLESIMAVLEVECSEEMK